METCVNCACQLDDPYGNNSNDEDLNLFNVYGPLSSIYKLNYLSSLYLDSSTLNNENTINWKLCENCLETFNNLHQFYEGFNQLRSLESKLAIEIQKLDDCIQNYQQHQQEENESKEDKKKSTSLHPIVVLKRLENDPVAQKFLSNSTCTRKRTRKSPKRNTRTIERIDTSFSDNSEYDESNSHAKETKDESDDNMENFNEDPLFIPSPQSELEEAQEIDDEDEYIPEAKEQKKGTKRKTTKTPVETKKLKKPKVEPVVKKPKRVPPADGLTIKRRRYLEDNKERKIITHYKTRKTKVPNPCWELECELDFPTQKECYEHTMSKHAQPDDFVCQNCSKRCKTSSGLKLHEEKICHKNFPGELIPLFQCVKCAEKGKNITFAFKIRYNQHLDRVHYCRDLTCAFPNCDFTTDTPRSLYQHTKNEHEVLSLPLQIEERTCHACEKIFKIKALHKYHNRQLHTDEGIAKYKKQIQVTIERSKEKRKGMPNLKDETFCSECMVDMLTHHGLVIHQKTVHGDPYSNFACDECDKKFKKQDGLKKHKVNVHVAERRFCCEACGKSFKSSCSLRTHMKASHEEGGRLKYNEDMRLYNKRRKIRREALAQSLSSGIPQFTGATYVDFNSGNSKKT